MTRKQIFFTSDWHIGHENCLKFDNRPFRDLAHMHSEIIKNFNKQVPKDGLTYFLGDIFLGSSEEAKTVLSQLNGTKILIVGNHDKKYEACYSMGFDAVMNSAKIKIHNQFVTLSHCPLMGVPREDMSEYPHKGIFWHGEYKNSHFSWEDNDQFHLHGHIHSPNGGKSEKIKGRQFDVGLPGNNYRPVHVSYIESWIMKTLKEENENNV